MPVSITVTTRLRKATSPRIARAVRGTATVSAMSTTESICDVAIATPRLGRLVNRVVHSKDAPAWEFGIGALIRNLAARGLLQ